MLSTAAWQSFQFPEQSKPTEPKIGFTILPQASYNRDLNIAVPKGKKTYKDSLQIEANCILNIKKPLNIISTTNLSKTRSEMQMKGFKWLYTKI